MPELESPTRLEFLSPQGEIIFLMRNIQDGFRVESSELYNYRGMVFPVWTQRNVTIARWRLVNSYTNMDLAYGDMPRAYDLVSGDTFSVPERGITLRID